MVVHKISLKGKDNPEFYALTKEHNLLMDRWNDYNNQLYQGFLHWTL